MIVQLLHGEHMKHAGADLSSVRVVGSWPRDQEEANSIIGQRIKIFSFVGRIQSLLLLLKPAIV